MKINQILLKFEIFNKNKETVSIVKSDLIRQNPFVIQNQHDVLIFRFLHITFKYFVKSSRGFIFLRKVNTVSNYRGIEDILKYFINNYIQPYLVKSSVHLVILKSLNYHWEIKVLYLGEKQINHTEFRKYFQRIPDLETKERVSTKYTSNSLVFTVYSQQNNCLKVTGCTKQIEKVPIFNKIFLSASQDITMDTYLTQAFIMKYLQTLAHLLWEDINLSFLTDYYTYFYQTFNITDESTLYKKLKNMFIESLEETDNQALKGRNMVSFNSIDRFMDILSEKLCAFFTIHFTKDCIKTYVSKTNLKGGSYLLKTCEDGSVEFYKNTESFFPLSSDSESETELVKPVCKKAKEAEFNCPRPAQTCSSEPVHKRKIPLKISESKNRNPFMKCKSPQIDIQNRDNLDQFTEQNDLQHYHNIAKENLINLTDNVEKLNQILKKTISSINSFLPQNLKTEELSCEVKCPLHCSLLSRAQAIKKLKGRKTKN